MNMDGARLFYLVEVSEHFDWMREQMARGRFDVLDDETSILFAARAVQQVDAIAPVYGHMPPPIKEGLVRSCIVFQFWEQHDKLQKQRQEPRGRREIPHSRKGRVIFLVDEGLPKLNTLAPQRKHPE